MISMRQPWAHSDPKAVSRARFHRKAKQQSIAAIAHSTMCVSDPSVFGRNASASCTTLGFAVEAGGPASVSPHHLKHRPTTAPRSRRRATPPRTHTTSSRIVSSGVAL